MKYILVLLTLLLVGCNEPNAEDRTESFTVLPVELRDCKFYYVLNDRGQSLHIVRCPNSSTSVRWQAGKITMTSAAIDYD